jgi:hypothetical protein
LHKIFFVQNQFDHVKCVTFMQNAAEVPSQHILNKSTPTELFI